jgi:hypothetical protein
MTINVRYARMDNQFAREIRTVIGGLLGLIYGLVLGWVSICVMGGGHGYNGAIFALPAVAMVPLVGAAWGFLHFRIVDVPLAFILIYAVFFDFGFFYGLDREAIEKAPSALLTWYALWIGWQIPALALLVVRLVKHIRS